MFYMINERNYMFYSKLHALKILESLALEPPDDDFFKILTES